MKQSTEFMAGYEAGRASAMNQTFTKEQFRTIVNIAEDGEMIPLYTLWASCLGEITEDNKMWAKAL